MEMTGSIEHKIGTPTIHHKITMTGDDLLLSELAEMFATMAQDGNSWKKLLHEVPATITIEWEANEPKWPLK